MNSDQTNSDEKAKAKQEAFLQKDYELKITYLSNQFARIMRTELHEEESKDSEGRQKSFWKRLVELEWLSGWRLEPFSTTRLAALFPLLVFILWLIILFASLSLPA